MPESGSYRIRPAGRHILTIGRDLIQDPHAALIELVKNAYDADSPDVAITFEPTDGGKYRITVADHGHGMTRETVTEQVDGSFDIGQVGPGRTEPRRPDHAGKEGYRPLRGVHPRQRPSARDDDRLWG